GDVRAAGPLRHPLSRRPELIRISRGEMAQRVTQSWRRAVQLEAARRAVAHGERTTVRCRRRSEEIESRELLHARERPAGALVADGDKPLLRGDAVEHAPALARLDAIHASPPWIELHEPRWRRFGGITQRQDVRGDALTESL